MKKLFSLLLALSVFLCTIPTSCAVGSTPFSDSSAVIDRETMLTELKKQHADDEKHLLSEGLITEESLARPVVTKGTPGLSYYYSTLSMPGDNFLIVLEDWENDDYYLVTYNGKECYKFEDGGVIVYVKTTAFYPSSASSGSYDKSGTYPSSDSSISNTLTRYMNSGDSSHYYYSTWRVFDADAVGYVQLALYGVRAYNFEEDIISLQHTVCASSGIAATSYSGAPTTPTFGLEITNTGSGRRYLGGFYISGFGNSTSLRDIAPLIQLGFSNTELSPSTTVTNLISQTASTALDVVIALMSVSDNSKKSYSTMTEPLSNPAKNIYSYSCSLKAPYKMTSVDDFFECRIGLLGADGTSLSYKVTYTR